MNFVIVNGYINEEKLINLYENIMNLKFVYEIFVNENINQINQKFNFIKILLYFNFINIFFI